MARRLSRRDIIAAGGLVAAGLAGCIGGSSEDGNPEDDDNDNAANPSENDGNGDEGYEYERTLEWGTQGSEHAAQICEEGEFGYWKWVLTTGGASLGMDPLPLLTVKFDDETEQTVEGQPRPGGSGAMQFEVFKASGGTVTDATVRFDGGTARSVLTISEGACVEDEEPPDLDVLTLDASAVNAGSATLHGVLSDMGGYDAVEVFFRWRNLDDDFYTYTEPQVLTDVGSFQETIENLETDAEFEFFAVARGLINEEPDVVVAGDVYVFDKSSPEDPNFETKPATDVNESTATLNGFLTDIGDFASVEVFFEYREVDTEEWLSTGSQTLTEMGPFSDEIEDLDVGDQYEFRAILIANETRFEGTIEFFSKEAAEPDVETLPAVDVNQSTATLVGNLTDLGDFEEVSVFFQYRRKITEEWSVTEPEVRGETGEFTAEISELEVTESYAFRAVVAANNGEIYGEILQFTKEAEVYWQVDFGEGENAPIPPHYWPDDGFHALGTDRGVLENPSHARMQTDGQLGDVTIEDHAFQFDDEDEPEEVSITFTVDDGGDARYLHLAVFVLPGPYDPDEVEDQELYDEISNEYAGGDTDTLTLSLPQG